MASQAGSSLDATFREVLRQHGLEPPEVQIFNLRLPDMPAALASGSVDAMVDIEPFNALAEERGTARKLTDFGRQSLAPYVLVARQDLIERAPEAVVAYLRALLRAQAAIREDITAAARAYLFKGEARLPCPAGTISRTSSRRAAGRNGVVTATGLLRARIFPGTDG